MRNGIQPYIAELPAETHYLEKAASTEKIIQLQDHKYMYASLQTLIPEISKPRQYYPSCEQQALQKCCWFRDSSDGISQGQLKHINLVKFLNPSSSSRATWKLTAHPDDTACTRLWSTDPEG